jgi:hypothetical protein
MNYLTAALIVGITILFAFITAAFLRRNVTTTAPATVAALQVSGAGILLMATIGIAGWEIQTWDGATRTERANKLIYRGAYVLGTYLFFLAIAWS